MPCPKHLIIALITLTLFSLCTACGDSGSQSSSANNIEPVIKAIDSEINEYISPEVSFLFKNDMEIERTKDADKVSVKARGPGIIQFTAFVYPGQPRSDIFFNNLVKGYIFAAKLTSFNFSDNAIFDSRRMVAGQVLDGKKVQHKVSNNWIESEFYTLDREDKVIYLNFINLTINRAQAESYFKIIADSIE